MTFEVLKRRAAFLRTAKGRRYNTRHFQLQVRRRNTDQDRDQRPRFGFTVTKKVGNAVVRNRIRRRLKEAVRLRAGELALPGYDYVLVARRSAERVPFCELTSELVRAIKRTRATNHGPEGTRDSKHGRP